MYTFDLRCGLPFGADLLPGATGGLQGQNTTTNRRAALQSDLGPPNGLSQGPYFFSCARPSGALSPPTMFDATLLGPPFGNRGGERAS